MTLFNLEKTNVTQVVIIRDDNDEITLTYSIEMNDIN